MQTTGFDHASVHADDLETSVAFYEEVFGLERIPTYDFPIPVQYLRCGDRQLHVFERETSPPEFHHFAFDVDDLEAVYRTARERSSSTTLGRALTPTSASYPTGPYSCTSEIRRGTSSRSTGRT